MNEVQSLTPGSGRGRQGGRWTGLAGQKGIVDDYMKYLR